MESDGGEDDEQLIIDVGGPPLNENLIRSPETIASSKLKFRRLRNRVTASADSGIVVGPKNYLSKLTQSLHQHQQDGTFCDFILKLDSGKEISAHKMVLSSSSTYFSGLFESQMLETVQGYVELKDMKDKPAMELLRFIYTGKMYLSRETIHDMLDASSRLHVEDAITHCSEYLISTISKGNCVEVYNMADKYCLPSAKANALHYKKMRFTELPVDQLNMLSLEQITSVVQSDALLCPSEWHVFDKVHDWLKHIEDEEERKKCTAILMKLVRFPLMSGEELVSKVSHIELMKNEESGKILTEAKDYHIVIPTQPVMQTPRTQVRHANIIYMVTFVDKDFFAYPLLSPYYKLFTESALELKKPPRSMIRPSVCVYNNFMYACGGVHDRSDMAISSARCFRYDPRTDSWFEIASMQEARQRFDLEAIGDYMFALGGWDENAQSNTYEMFSFATNEWKKFLLPHGHHVPNRHAICAVEDSIYASGGNVGAYTSNSMVQYVHDLNLLGSLIVRQLPAMHKARKRHRMFSQNRKIYAVGGMSSSIEVFDIVTEQWTLYEGFQDSFGAMSRVIGACPLDPNRIILCNFRESKSICWLINLDKDPEKEKSQFVKKLNKEPKIPSTITTFGSQLWLPSQGLLSGGRRTETPPTEAR